MNSAITALAILAGCATAQPYVETMNVASCADLVAAAEATSGGDILGQLAEEYITCDGWTTVEVKQNKLKLVSDLPRQTLTKVRFAVDSGAVLRVEVPGGALEFASSDPFDQSAASDLTQEVDGGYLYVAAGGRARFFTPAVFMYNGGVTTSSSSVESMNHGGCVYNEGYLRFEGGFTAGVCKTVPSDPSILQGDGAGLWNGPEGQVVFKGFTSFEGNGEPTGLSKGGREGRDGGAIYNAGKISFFEPTEFIDNHAYQGGSIYNAEGAELKFLKRAKVTFDESYAQGNGGHIANYGLLVLRNTGWFHDGLSEGSGGAIYTLGEMLFVKHVDFIDNTAGAHGGAIATNYDLIEFLPEDVTYEGNSRTNADFDFECNNVYANGSADGGEDGYTCIPGGPGSSYSTSN
eukprot:g2151.t1